jgi:NAD(P)-dependent dehydrogenase (short-subunit alcohol dehydrogenase family)
VDTDTSSFTKTDVGRKAALGIQALQHVAGPEDIVPVVAFLAPDDSCWIIGESVRVEGGSKLSDLLISWKFR